MAEIKIISREELESKTIITLKELLNSNIPEQEWYVENLIPKRGVTLIAGKPKEFKSFLAMYLTCCLAGNKDFLNLKIKKSKVMYIDEENDDTELKRRFEKLKPELDINDEDTENVGLVIFKGIKVNTEQGVNKLKILINLFKPNVIIVDSLIRVFEGDENSSKDMKTIFNNIKELMKKYDTTWVILHHVRKMNNKWVKMEDIRGSGDIVAQASSILTVNRNNSNTFTLTQEAVRGLPQPISPIQFSAQDIPINGKWAIKIVYLGRPQRELTTVEAAERDIENWLTNKQQNSIFKSGQIYKALEDKNGRNSLLDGLKRLERKGIIECVNKNAGKWRLKPFNHLTPIV